MCPRTLAPRKASTNGAQEMLAQTELSLSKLLMPQAFDQSL